jgi:hypothetical protein
VSKLIYRKMKRAKRALAESSTQGYYEEANHAWKEILVLSP